MPVVAPIGVEGAQLLNINADTVAGEIAVALKADLLAFLTDVPGVLDAEGKTLERLSASEVESLVARWDDIARHAAEGRGLPEGERRRHDGADRRRAGSEGAAFGAGGTRSRGRGSARSEVR